MAAETRKRAAGGAGAAIEYVYEVFSSLNRGAGPVVEIRVKKALFGSFAGGEQTNILTAATATAAEAATLEP